MQVVRAVYREPILPTGHVSLLSARALRRALAEAGLRVESAGRTGLYLPVIAEAGGERGRRVLARLAELRPPALDPALRVPCGLRPTPRSRRSRTATGGSAGAARCSASSSPPAAACSTPGAGRAATSSSSARAPGSTPRPRRSRPAWRAGLDVEQASLEALPFPDASFDRLLAADVLEHVDDDARALRELRRVAAPGAVLVITVPAHPRLWSAHDEALHHRRRYRRAELLDARARRRVGARGGDVVELLPAAARRARAAAPRGASGTDHDRTPGWADRVLVLPLAARGAGSSRRGARLPWGVSLAVSCRAVEPDAQA